MTTPARPLRLPRYPLPSMTTSTTDARRWPEQFGHVPRCHECGERRCQCDREETTLPPEGPLQFEE